MFSLRPNQPTQRRGKTTPPQALPKPRPASLKSTKRTLAQQLGIRKDCSAEADKLERRAIKQKKQEQGPAVRLPVPKAIQVLGPDPIRDAYLERGKSETKKPETKPTEPIAEDVQAVINDLSNDMHALNQNLDDIPQNVRPSSLLDQLKNFR